MLLITKFVILQIIRTRGQSQIENYEHISKIVTINIIFSIDEYSQINIKILLTRKMKS